MAASDVDHGKMTTNDRFYESNPYLRFTIARSKLLPGKTCINGSENTTNTRMDFQKNVIDKSFETPVVVDFWAPWCGPCRMLGPTIERLATEQAGRWALVKVNVDENQDLASRYHVRGIPDVKLFHEGQVVAEFAGVKSKGQIEAWLDAHLPDARLGDLDDIIQRLDTDPGALAELQQFVAMNPDVAEARLALARKLVFSTPAGIKALLEPINLGDKYHDDAEDLRTIAAFLTHEPDDSRVGKQIAAAQIAAEAGDEKALVEHIIEATQLDKSYEDELPRKTGIALFRQWGPQHELTKAYRWKFDMMLY